MARFFRYSGDRNRAVTHKPEADRLLTLIESRINTPMGVESLTEHKTRYDGTIIRVLAQPTASYAHISSPFTKIKEQEVGVLYLFLMNPNGHVFTFKLGMDSNFTLNIADYHFILPHLNAEGDNSLLTVQSNPNCTEHQIRLPMWGELSGYEFGASTYRAGISGWFQMEFTNGPILWKGYGQTRIVQFTDGATAVYIGFPLPFMPLGFTKAGYVWPAVTYGEDLVTPITGWKSEYSNFLADAYAIKPTVFERGTGRNPYTIVGGVISKRFITIFEELQEYPTVSNFYLGYETEDGIIFDALPSVGGQLTATSTLWSGGETNTWQDGTTNYATWSLGTLVTTSAPTLDLAIEYNVVLNNSTIYVKTNNDTVTVESSLPVGSAEINYNITQSYEWYCQPFYNPAIQVVAGTGSLTHDETVHEDYISKIVDTLNTVTIQMFAGEHSLESFSNTRTYHAEMAQRSEWIRSISDSEESTPTLEPCIEGSISHNYITNSSSTFTGVVTGGRTYIDTVGGYEYTYLVDIINQEYDENTIELKMDYDYSPNGDWVFIYSIKTYHFNGDEELISVPGLLTGTLNNTGLPELYHAIRPTAVLITNEQSTKYTFKLAYCIGNSVGIEEITSYGNWSKMQYGPSEVVLIDEETPFHGQDITGVSCKIDKGCITYTYIVRTIDGSAAPVPVKRVIGVININNKTLPHGIHKKFEINETNRESVLGAYNHNQYIDIAAIGIHNKGGN